MFFNYIIIWRTHKLQLEQLYNNEYIYKIVYSTTLKKIKVFKFMFLHYKASRNENIFNSLKRKNLCRICDLYDKDQIF